MYITCLDVEGVLVPEIWIAFAEESGIPELKRTTRDEPDYNKLMRWRLDILKEHGLGIKEIPRGVFNVITGSGSKFGQYMLESKRFRRRSPRLTRFREQKNS